MMMLPNHLGLHALSLKLCHTKWVLDTFLKSHMTQVWSYWLAVSVKWLRHHFTLLSQIPASDQSWVLDIVLSSFPVSTLTFISFYMILLHTSTYIMWSLISDQCKSAVSSPAVDHLFTLIHKLISVCNVTCSVTNVAAGGAEVVPQIDYSVK